MVTVAKVSLFVVEVVLFFFGLMACQPQMGHVFWLPGLVSVVLGTLVVFLAWKKIEKYEAEKELL